MVVSSSPVLDAVVRVAMEATGAERARLVARDARGERLEVVAGSGGDAGWRPAAADVASTGAIGYVMATGQPQILSHPGASSLCTPCICQDEVVGALELADTHHGPGFSFEDLEVAGLLAGVAAEAIVARWAVPTIEPGPLTADLRRVALADPGRYATIARLVQGLLDG
jgi:GAF domain-containing protein